MITMTDFKALFLEKSEITNPPDVDAWLTDYLLPVLVNTLDIDTGSVRIETVNLPFADITMKEVRWFRNQLVERGFACDTMNGVEAIRIYGLNLT